MTKEKSVNHTQIHSDLNIIRPNQLVAFLSISKTTLWRLENNDPTFPKRYKIGFRGVGYNKQDVIDWLEANAEGVL